jgi:hypothetical protein
MRRLEAMEDRRRGVLAWRNGLSADPTLWPEAAKRRLRTARRVLTCAGLDAEAIRDVQALGLAAIIDRAERKWVADTNSDFTRAMASLDADLRQAEEWMTRWADWQSGTRPQPPSDAPESATESTPDYGTEGRAN